MGPRHRPLHACGVSVLAIADIAYGRTLDFNGPLGSTWRRMTKMAQFASPLIYAMRLQWLAILSFLDDHFLEFEKIIEKLCPPSAYVFDKIDETVPLIESLPEKLDDTVNKFPEIIFQIPFIKWALVHVISWLNYLISTLNHRGLQDSRIKEISVDLVTNCDKQLGSALDSSYIIKKESTKGSFASMSEDFEAENEAGLSHKKESYKKASERGKNEEDECEENEGEDMDADKESEIIGRSESIGEDDSLQLLELFESEWLMRPVTSSSKESSRSNSGYYQR